MHLILVLVTLGRTAQMHLGGRLIVVGSSIKTDVRKPTRSVIMSIDAFTVEELVVIMAILIAESD